PERAPSRARSARCTRQSRPRVVQHTVRTRREGTRRGAASATALHEAASEPDPLRRVHDLAFDPERGNRGHESSSTPPEHGWKVPDEARLRQPPCTKPRQSPTHSAAFTISPLIRISK